MYSFIHLFYLLDYIEELLRCGGFLDILRLGDMLLNHIYLSNYTMIINFLHPFISFNYSGWDNFILGHTLQFKFYLLFNYE